MPLFGKKKKESLNDSPTHSQATTNQNSTQPNSKTGNGYSGHTSPEDNNVPPRPVYNFHCQLAHGSPTGIISGFTNVKELYSKIAQCYNIESSEIIFCTLNTHKIDMDKLLGGQIGLDDFLFAHIKGQKKEIEVVKTEDALGLTITDNGAGYAFIKRIKPGSVIDQISHIEPGDHIEKIDGENFVGKRHFDVAKRLKEIEKGSTFILRLVSPEKSPYANLNPRSAGRGHGNVGSGKKTLRLKAKGDATEQDAPDEVESTAIAAINKLIESLLGISDEEMAQNIWELGKTVENPHDFALAVDRDLGDFAFPDGLVFDFWGAISDAKSGRLHSSGPVEFTESF